MSAIMDVVVSGSSGNRINKLNFIKSNPNKNSIFIFLKKYI